MLPLLIGGYYLFFSTESLEGMSYRQAQKQKGQIQVVYSKRLIKAIKQFSDKEVINLPEDLIEKA
jgi:hypothetical protein